TLVLLVGTGLFVRSVQNLGVVDLGFDARHVLRVRAASDFRSAGPARRTKFFDGLSEALRHTSGIRSVALASGGPFAGQRAQRVIVPGRAEEKDWPVVVAATPDFFATIGL